MRLLLDLPAGADADEVIAVLNGFSAAMATAKVRVAKIEDNGKASGLTFAFNNIVIPIGRMGPLALERPTPPARLLRASFNISLNAEEYTILEHLQQKLQAQAPF